MTENKIDISIGLDSMFTRYFDVERDAFLAPLGKVCDKTNLLNFINNYKNLTLQHSDNIGLQYFAPLKFKEYCLAIRDTLLQYDRSLIRRNQEEISLEQLQKYKEQLFFNLVALGVQTKESIKQIAADTFDESTIEKYSEIVKPWEAIEKQLLKITDQTSDISQNYNQILSAAPIVSEISNLINTAIEINDTSFDNVELSIHKLYKYLNEDSTDPSKLFDGFSDVDKHIKDIQLSRSNLDIQIEQKLNLLPTEIKLPVKSVKGSLVVKEQNLRKNLKEWIWFEILPKVYELWELNEITVSHLKSTSINISNRLSIAANGDFENFQIENITSTLDYLKVEYDDLLEKKDQLKGETLQHLANELDFSKLYSVKEEFLPSGSRRTSMDTTSIEKSPIVESIVKSYKQGMKILQAASKEDIDNSSYNAQEILTKYLQKLKHNEHDNYNNIFLTKSYTGKSFYIPREEITAKAHDSIQLWSQGFKGGLLISGDRYSGKTSFAEKLLSSQNAKRSIILNPNVEITYKGRKHTPSYNLSDSLNFLKKHNTGEQVVLLLDDIGQWFTDKVNIITNIRALLKFVDYNYTKFFLICTIDNALLYHLDKRLNIANSFTHCINVSVVNYDEFFKIVEMRHGATHMNIIAKEGQLISSEVLKGYTKKVLRRANYNIGDALRYWTLSLIKEENGSIKFDAFESHELPDFLNNDNSIILKSIILARTVNEYQLRYILGPMFRSKYKDILNRLMGIGLIKRTLYQDLEISEDLVNQLTDKLKCEGYL